MKQLPATWRGARVMRGLGMDHEKCDQLVERKALDEFDATREIFIVVDDNVLSDRMGGTGEIKAFRDETAAIRYARACANGNVDQRVLRVTQQVLVVATENEL